MIYLIHELTPEILDFIKSLKNVVHLDNYIEPKQNVVTFDGPYESVYNFRQKLNMPFEMFVFWNVLGTKIMSNKGERFCTWTQIEMLMKHGGRPQWHTRSHRNLTELEDQELKDEVRPAFQCNWIAYPYGEYNINVIRKVKNYFVGAVTVHQGNDKKYSLKRKEL